MLMLIALSACNVVVQTQPALTAVSTPIARSSTATPSDTPNALLATPTVEPTPTPDLPAIWIIDGVYNRLAAIEPQAGQVLNAISYQYNPAIGSRDGRWQYLIEATRENDWWNITVLVLDTTRSANPKRISIARVYSDLRPTLDLAFVDEKRELIVTLGEKYGTQTSITRVYVVDVTLGRVLQRHNVFSDDVTNDPLVLQRFPSDDGRHLFIAQNSMRQPRASKYDQAIWLTRIAVLNLSNGDIERVVEVPGDVQAHGFWMAGRLSPDGRMLYLMQQIVRNSSLQGYRFVALDTSNYAIARTQLVESSEGGDVACNTGDLRFTSDGRYLYGYCPADHPIRPAGYVQYLDTQTGLLEAKAVLESKVNPSETAPYGMWHVLSSPDNHLLYVVHWKSREVFVFDVAQRKVVRSTIVKEAKATLTNPFDTLVDTVTNWFVGTANAKMSPQPGAILDADGRRLYFVDIVDLDKGDGIWAVETASLKLMGHWLTGKDIYGLQLSTDDSELYAASPGDHTIYVLDALTGQTRRALNLKQSGAKPLGFVTGQPY